MVVWSVIAIVLAGIIIVAASDLEVKIRIDREGDDDRWKINFRWLYGLVRYSIKIPFMNLSGNKGLEIKEKQVNDRSNQVLNEYKPKVDRNLLMKYYGKYMKMLKNTFEFSRWFKETLSHIRCNELTWQTHIGAGEAVETATVTGLVWGLKGSIIGYISKFIRLQVQPKLAIVPHYNESSFATELNCIFKIRTGYAILAGLLLLVRVLRIKGGMKTWRNILFKAS